MTRASSLAFAAWRVDGTELIPVIAHATTLANALEAERGRVSPKVRAALDALQAALGKAGE